jgi:HEAT repeat protein
MTTSPLGALREQLSGSDNVARLTAIAQLEANGSPEAVTILGAFFMDSNVSARLEAAQALLRINSTLAQNYIRTAMSDKQLTARRQVAMQALEIDPEASYPILRVLIVDKDETVRVNTVTVAQFLGTSQARVLLQQAVRDSSPMVQKAAIDALAAMGFVPTPAP